MKKTWVRILVIALVCAAALIGVAVAVDISAAKPGSVGRSEHSLTYFYADTEGATRFFFDGVLLDGAISGHVDSFLSCDGSFGIIRAGTGLYSVDKDGLLKIYPAGVERAAVSLDDSTVVFTTATQLHIYDRASGSLTDIKPEGISGVPAIAVSPDGKTVLMTVKNADGTYEAYRVKGESFEKIADNAYVLAVSDSMRSFWYMEPDTASLVYKKGSSVKRAAENVSGLVEFNRDLTEAIFDVSGVTHCSVKGSKARALVADMSVYCTKPECASTQGGESATGSVADVSTLFGAVFYSTFSSSTDSSARKSYNLYYIDRFRHVTDIATGVYEFRLTRDGKTVACLADSDVYVTSAANPASPKKVASNIYTFTMTPNGSRMWLVGLNQKLYCIEGGSTPVEMADGIAYSTATNEGSCLFLTDYDGTGTLNLAEGLVVPTEIKKGVAHVEVKQGVCFCYSGFYDDEYGNSVFDVYTSADGKEFSLALEAALKKE